MKIGYWHGYLLRDTGSNIFTREMTSAWLRAGHEVTVFCQDPEAQNQLAGATIVRPEIGNKLPVFVVDSYADLQAVHVSDMSEEERAAYIRANAIAAERALADDCDALLCNHLVMGGPVGQAISARTGVPFGVYIHGSELEYALQADIALRNVALDSIRDARWVFAGSRHIVHRTRDLLDDDSFVERTHLLPPGVDVAGFAPERGSRDDLIAELSRMATTGSEREPDADVEAKLGGVGRFVLYFGKLMNQKGVHLLIDAWRALEHEHPDMHLVVVGFGDAREELEARAAGHRVVFTGGMDHSQLQRLVPLAEIAVVPSVLAEAFGMVAAEAAACGVVPVVADHSGLAEVAEGLGDACRTFDGTVEDLHRVLAELLALSEGDRRSLGLQARKRCVSLWSWDALAARFVEIATQAGT